LPTTIRLAVCPFDPRHAARASRVTPSVSPRSGATESVPLTRGKCLAGPPQPSTSAPKRDRADGALAHLQGRRTTWSGRTGPKASPQPNRSTPEPPTPSSSGALSLPPQTFATDRAPDHARRRRGRTFRCHHGTDVVSLDGFVVPPATSPVRCVLRSLTQRRRAVPVPATRHRARRPPVSMLRPGKISPGRTWVVAKSGRKGV
jgi:hypothetical protein